MPDALCVELKSLKLYLQGFRNRGIFYEQVVNVILDDLVGATRPRRMTVEGRFEVRGGISSVVSATYDEAAEGGGGEGPRLPGPAFRGRGDSPAAIAAGERLRRKGIKATFDLLGEDVLDREAARRAAEAQSSCCGSSPRISSATSRSS